MNSVVLWLRSLAFNAFYFGWLTIVLSMMWLFLPLNRRVLRGSVRFWAWVQQIALRILVGIRFEARGLENIPPGPVILASKHQSAWDTGIYYLLVDEPVYVLKKELMSIPFWGWYARKAGSVPVDREGGAQALKAMVRGCLVELDHGAQIVIFPEGTRTAPESRVPYLPGIAALYARADAPVVPVAVNSGLFWGRRKFVKRPGTILLEALPAMPRGLDRRTFMAELENRIETATQRLIDEARSNDA